MEQKHKSSPGALDVVNAVAETLIGLGQIAILACVFGIGLLLLWGMC